MDKSADEMCATVRITHSFFAAAAKLPLRGDGILFHVKHGTRKCRDVGFRRDSLGWPGCQPASFVEARETAEVRWADRRSRPSPAGIDGRRGLGPVVAPRKGSGRRTKAPEFGCRVPFARPV